MEPLVECAGSSKSYIWGVENSAQPSPSAGLLGQIAAALGVTLQYLLEESGAVTEEYSVDVAFFRRTSGSTSPTEDGCEA